MDAREFFGTAIRFNCGAENPEKIEKPFYTYMVCHPDWSPHYIKNRTGISGNNTFCFCRIGGTQNYLPDGRLVCIGGQYGVDDSEGDFVTYNDVIVISNPKLVQGHHYYRWPIPENFPVSKSDIANTTMLGTDNPDDVTIYGYPQDEFPKTFNHTATYIRTKDGMEYIYIVGGTGYNIEKSTRLYRLRLYNFSIESVESSGEVPKCCVKEHQSELFTRSGRQIISVRVKHINKDGCILTEKKTEVYELDIESNVWTLETVPYYELSSSDTDMSTLL